MEIRRWHLILVPLLVWAVVLVGCAKRPALTQATAPPPLGSATTGAGGVGQAGQGGSTEDQQTEGSAQSDQGAAGSAAAAGQSGSGSVQSDAGSGQSGGAEGQAACAGESGAGPVTNGSVERGDAGQSASESGPSGRTSDSGQTSSGAVKPGTESTQSGSASAQSGSESAEGSSAATEGGERNGQGAQGGGAAEGGGAGQGSGGTQIAAVQADGGQTGAQVLAAARPEPREFTVIPDLRDVHFDFDRYDIRPEIANVLDTNADWLKANLNFLVLIEGHCDERGTDEYNLALGEHRAKAAMNYLVSQGVQASRLTVISYGEERPLCTEKIEACWAKNRRVHFLVKPQ